MVGGVIPSHTKQEEVLTTALQSKPKAGERYRFNATSNRTVVLRKGYHKVINDSSGRPLTTEFVQPVKAIFNNAYFETSDKATAEMLAAHEFFGREFYWHPIMDSKDNPIDMDMAEMIEKAKLARAKRKRIGIQNARESGLERTE